MSKFYMGSFKEIVEIMKSIRCQREGLKVGRGVDQMAVWEQFWEDREVGKSNQCIVSILMVLSQEKTSES